MHLYDVDKYNFYLILAGMVEIFISLSFCLSVKHHALHISLICAEDLKRFLTMVVMIKILHYLHLIYQVLSLGWQRLFLIYVLKCHMVRTKNILHTNKNGTIIKPPSRIACFDMFNTYIFPYPCILVCRIRLSAPTAAPKVMLKMSISHGNNNMLVCMIYDRLAGALETYLGINKV